MREEQTLAEIENYLEGFNQPTYRGMRIDDHRVATWSSQHGWSGIVGRMRSGYSEPLRVECAYAGTGNRRRCGRDNECSNRHQGYPALAVDAIALFLVACLFVPVLSAEVPQEARKFVILGAGAFTILAVCRLGSLVISATNKYRADREARRTFHLTPTTQRSWWCPTRQNDGTIVTSLYAELMAKNRASSLFPVGGVTCR